MGKRGLGFLEAPWPWPGLLLGEGLQVGEEVLQLGWQEEGEPRHDKVARLAVTDLMRDFLGVLVGQRARVFWVARGEEVDGPAILSMAGGADPVDGLSGG